jgi:2-phosphosulfolactate phosphatase
VLRPFVRHDEWVETGRRSDVGTAPFEPWPEGRQLHVEWGPPGARLAAERGDIVVIVDVLSFSTSVVLTATRGGTALAYSAAELDEMGGRDEAARLLNAEVIAKDRAATTARFSLSPASLATVAPGDRVIFTSLNGAACTAAASKAPIVLVGALTNASAVAATILSSLRAGVAARCTIVPCGERWTSVADEPDSLRPGVEDLLGAGAIVSALPQLHISTEAWLAAATFQAARRGSGIGDALRNCVGGRELIQRGFAEDVELAARLDATTAVPLWDTRSQQREFVSAPSA